MSFPSCPECETDLMVDRAKSNDKPYICQSCRTQFAPGATHKAKRGRGGRRRTGE
jgi:ribosomal protein L37AE/L43A